MQPRHGATVQIRPAQSIAPPTLYAVYSLASADAPTDGSRAIPNSLNSQSRAWESKLSAEGVLHIDHLFARMQRLNTYEAKTNAMTRIGSNLSQVLPPPFSCE